MSDEKKELTAAGGWMLAVGLLMSPAFLLWRAFAFSKLWEWFVVYYFGLPPVSVICACGIALLIGMVQRQSAEKVSDDSVRGMLIYGVIAPGLSLLLGLVFVAMRGMP